MTTPANWQSANLADADAVLERMREFYREERLTFDPTAQGGALRALLAGPTLGAVFLLRYATGALPSGYLVLTWSFSLEFGGRFALLDELWIAPDRRGCGEGRRAVEFAVAWARDHGAQALRLEVDRGNARARSLYEKSGLTGQARDLMILRLAPSPGPAASP